MESFEAQLLKIMEIVKHPRLAIADRGNTFAIVIPTGQSFGNHVAIKRVMHDSGNTYENLELVHVNDLITMDELEKILKTTHAA